jgi:integrase
LLDAVESDYVVNGRRSLKTLRAWLTALRTAFGEKRACDLTAERIETFKRDRLAEGYAPATVNRMLAALRRGYRLAVTRKQLNDGPMIEMLREHNARQGFVEPATFAAIVPHLPTDLQDWARFGYLSAWRLGEISTLEWADVDRAAGVATLRREHSKTGDPRILPLTGELAALIERRWTAREYRTVDRETALSPLVFHRAGRPVGDTRKAWANACAAAGVPGILFHDLRRSAIRNMEKAGVSQSVAMKISGHKTASVYRRYRIVDEADVRDALARTDAYVRQAPAANVRSLPRAEKSR